MRVARQRAECVWDASPGNQKETRKAFIAGKLNLTVGKMGQYVRVLFGITDFPFAMLGERLPACLRTVPRRRTPTDNRMCPAVEPPALAPTSLPPLRLPPPIWGELP
jgi:hypothetical protein